MRINAAGNSFFFDNVKVTSVRDAVAVTDASGEYYFTSASGGIFANAVYGINLQLNANYQIRLDNPANYTSGGALSNVALTIKNQTTQNGFKQGTDSDASLVFNPAGSAAGTFPVISAATGAAGDNDHNFDFGFAPSASYSVGNRVWYDTNNNGIIDTNEVGISGVAVSIFADADNNGQPDNVNSPINTVSTSTGGYYRFDALAAGSYVLRINPSNFADGATLAQYQNTTGINTAATDSFGASSNAENGVNPTGASNVVQTNGILSNTITLTGTSAPTSEPDVPTTGTFAGQGAADNQADMTIDFGFYCYNLNGTIFSDSGAGAKFDNGSQDVGENGLPSVRVQLYDSAGNEIPVGADGILGTSDDGAGGMLTNSSGSYAFKCLSPGDFRVVVTPNGGASSTPTSTNPNDNTDNDDNGFPDTTGNFSGKIISGLVTLTPGNTGAKSNNTVNNAAGLTSNPTLDFGFVFAPTASSANVSGKVLGANRRGGNRVLVSLFNADTQETLTRFTNQFGYFNFQDVPAGNFYVLTVTDRRSGMKQTQTFQLSEDRNDLVFYLTK